MSILPENNGQKQEPKKTRGEAYVAEFLSDHDFLDMDAEWIAESINNGSIAHCERCHFLHLPTLPFPIDRAFIKAGIEPIDACDVCMNIPWELQFPNYIEHMDAALAQGPAQLAEARAERARNLYQLWISGSDNASTLVWAAMGESLRPLRRCYSQKPEAQDGDGGPGLKMAA